MKVVWDRLIRFVATDGRTLRGEPILPHLDYDIGSTTEKDKLQAKVISGADVFSTKGDTKVTDEIATVKEILGPLTPEEVTILRCIGLKYTKHSMLLSSRHFQSGHGTILAVRETGRSNPTFPFYFVKPSTILGGHNVTVRIPKIAQDDQADYEGEMVSFLSFLSWVNTV